MVMWATNMENGLTGDRYLAWSLSFRSVLFRWEAVTHIPTAFSPFPE